MRFALLMLLTWVAPIAGQVRITYLANEGVLLEMDKAAVLIDALFRDSLDDYARHTPEVQERLENGRPPFHRVKLALATHFHLDHWDAGAISRFLRQNPGTMFGSTPDGVAMMPSSLRTHVRALWPDGAANPPTTIEIAGFSVQAIPLQHGRTQNLAFRLRAGGRWIVHVGDAEPAPENLERLRSLPAPDVLLVPFWWLLNETSIDFLKKEWRPRHVIAFHFGAKDVVRSAAVVRQKIPEVWICTKAGESRAY